jgi:hypothetical protein
MKRSSRERAFGRHRLGRSLSEGVIGLMFVCGAACSSDEDGGSGGGSASAGKSGSGSGGKAGTGGATTGGAGGSVATGGTNGTGGSAQGGSGGAAGVGAAGSGGAAGNASVGAAGADASAGTGGTGGASGAAGAGTGGTATGGAGGTGGAVVLAAHRYVIDKHALPTNNAQARDLGLDVNGDSTVDNRLGMVLATFASQGFDPQGPADQAVNRGDILTLVDLGSAGFTSGPATFTLYSGDNAQPAPCLNAGDTVCRRHLAGTGTFDVAATSARDTPLTGTLVAGELVTGTGLLHVELSLATTPMTFELLAARVKLTGPTDTALASGVIAGAIKQSDIDTALIPAWAVSFDATMNADCPGAPPTCGCASGSQGKSYHDLFDTSPNDCTITATELRNNSLIMSLLAPDVTIGGQQALSVGIGFTATKATFTP